MPTTEGQDRSLPSALLKPGVSRELSMSRIKKIKKRLSEATPGPWNIWDGPAYAGGGKDLCIGHGETWLANMDTRWGVRHEERVNHDVACCAAGVCGDPDCEAKDPKKAPGKLKDHNPDDCDICSMSSKITREQSANAALIAHAPEDIAFLANEVETLVEAMERLQERARHGNTMAVAVGLNIALAAHRKRMEK